ncbi:cation-translocating P-type ATPase [Desulfopila aestuarii]|uniref:Sodium/potassium-transporting ATPase subunit alpha n=1 Tax=Desulfopila aestuarii DSM 18488 TaxID=1121416 RepID=A0A1M7YB86_9BACT|nr:cation-transporting P-type ATPase [Desulfopila aestuarii]SHO49872.1 sodium/potassium-transporting ATPase subunit alpha [Desulfopila aestuarii DSM 18488]
MNSRLFHIGRLVPDEVFAHLHSRSSGLRNDEVRERLAHVGPNRFDQPDRWKNLRRLARQFTNFFTLLLFLSAAICMVAHFVNPGESMNVLGWALFGVALLNAMFSFVQEYRAEKAMEALKNFLPQLVQVRRDDRVVEQNAEELVPGDVVLLAEGDKVPADLRLVESHDLQVDNSPLTGESMPCDLTSRESDTQAEEPENICFAGCTVVRGTGLGVVFATGIRTEFGKVAHLSQTIKRSSSPLERETSHMVRVLTIIACIMGVGFFLYGVLSGKPLWTNLVFMMGIIVANVPEGLLPTFTLSLAMGSLRMAKKNVLVKSLNAVESLGAVHVICSDKTGTLTLNRLAITQMVAAHSGEALSESEQQDLLRFALAASEVRETEAGLFGDALDVAVAAKCAGCGLDFHEVQAKIRHVFAFDVQKRRSAGVLETEHGSMFVVKGAFEAIQPMLVGERAAADQAESVMQKMAGQGLRVIAVAWRKMAAAEDERLAAPDPSLQDELEHNLALAGFIGIEDPVRPEVPRAVEKCRKAGIDIILITGDHQGTALAVAQRIGIAGEGDDADMLCLTGKILEKLSVTQLTEKINEGVRVFARTTPEQKMKIVTALQQLEKVVAMTGDGVNDAPALKAADVGIAMGRQGTDVARESAQIILLDDNFASIVAGIEEGRTVFMNIKKFTNYVLVSNGPEILPYLLYIVLPVPLALNVIQILSIDLGTDIIPSMGLGQEPPSAEVMEQPPRDLARGLLTPALLVHSYLFLGLLEGAWSLFLFFYVLVNGGWQYGVELPTDSPLYRSATGIALATILLMQIGNLIGRRYDLRSGLDLGLLTNKLILFGIVIQVFFSWATLYWPPVQKVLNTAPVSTGVYGLAWLGIILIFGSDYLRKRLVSARRKRTKVTPPPEPASF